MSSLVTNFNSLTVNGSTAQEIANWVTTADLAVGKFVQTHRNCRQLSRLCTLHTVDATRLHSCVVSRRRCVLGIIKHHHYHYHHSRGYFEVE